MNLTLSGNHCSRLPNGSLMEIAKVYPLDAVFDNLDDVPEDVSLCLLCYLDGLSKKHASAYHGACAHG